MLDEDEELLEVALKAIMLELRTIRELLEWQNTHTIQREAQEQAEQEAGETRLKAFQDEILEKGRQVALEVQRQAYAEHERLYHAGQFRRVRAMD